VLARARLRDRRAAAEGWSTKASTATVQSSLAQQENARLQASLAEAQAAASELMLARSELAQCRASLQLAQSGQPSEALRRELDALRATNRQLAAAMDENGTSPCRQRDVDAAIKARDRALQDNAKLEHRIQALETARDSLQTANSTLRASLTEAQRQAQQRAHAPGQRTVASQTPPWQATPVQRSSELGASVLEDLTIASRFKHAQQAQQSLAAQVQSLQAQLTDEQARSAHHRERGARLESALLACGLSPLDALAAKPSTASRGIPGNAPGRRPTAKRAPPLYPALAPPLAGSLLPNGIHPSLTTLVPAGLSQTATPPALPFQEEPTVSPSTTAPAPPEPASSRTPTSSTTLGSPHGTAKRSAAAVSGPVSSEHNKRSRTGGGSMLPTAPAPPMGSGPADGTSKPYSDEPLREEEKQLPSVDLNRTSRLPPRFADTLLGACKHQL
jgi:hypothetical protein